MSKPNKRNKHEAKPEQASGFKGDYGSSTPAHPKWRVGNAERAPLDLADMSPSPDFTGRWMDEAFGFYLYINHAGRHLELLLACVESGHSGKPKDAPLDKHRSETRLIRLGGDLDADDRCSLYVHVPGEAIDNKSFPCGHMACTDRRLELDLIDTMLHGVDKGIRERIVRYATRTAERINRDASHFPHHLVTPSVPYEFRSQYWFPSTPWQIERLPKFLLEAREGADSSFLMPDKGGTQAGYIDLVRDYFELRSGGALSEGLGDGQIKQRTANIAAVLDELVHTAYQDALTAPVKSGGIDNFGREEWSYRTQLMLFETKIAVPGFATPRSLMELTQAILDNHPGLTLNHFVDYLSMRATSGGHYYGAHLLLAGVDGNSNAGKGMKYMLKRLKGKARQVVKRLAKNAPVGSLLATIEVRKEEDPDLVPESERKEPEWIAYYAGILGGLSISGSIGSGAFDLADSDGCARNVYGQAWLPEQLPGRVTLKDFGGSAKIGPFGPSLAFTVLAFYGSGGGCPPTPLQIDFSGFADAFAPPSAKIGGTRLGGMAILLDEHTSDTGQNFEPPEYQFEYSGHTATAPIHFPINGAAPHTDACALLEILAANELATLSRKDCEIAIHGYADQPGSEIKNLILSRSRAISVYNYLKGITYSRMAHGALSSVKSEQEEISGFDLIRKKDKDAVPKIETPSTTGVSITSHGEPPPKEGNASESYDSRYRRVDITINKARLMLRRGDDGTGS